MVKVVAKAWVDPEYKKRLLNDATSAIRIELPRKTGQKIWLLLKTHLKLTM